MSRLTEAQFRSSPVWLDESGYAWQRMRGDGYWRSTDGRRSGLAELGDAMPPEKWGPYTILVKL